MKNGTRGMIRVFLAASLLAMTLALLGCHGVNTPQEGCSVNGTYYPNGNAPNGQCVCPPIGPCTISFPTVRPAHAGRGTTRPPSGRVLTNTSADHFVAVGRRSFTSAGNFSSPGTLTGGTYNLTRTPHLSGTNITTEGASSAQPGASSPIVLAGTLNVGRPSFAPDGASAFKIFNSSSRAETFVIASSRRNISTLSRPPIPTLGLIRNSPSTYFDRGVTSVVRLTSIGCVGRQNTLNRIVAFGPLGNFPAGSAAHNLDATAASSAIDNRPHPPVTRPMSIARSARMVAPRSLEYHLDVLTLLQASRRQALKSLFGQPGGGNTAGSGFLTSGGIR
jgi:hypothetical protein